MQKSFANHFSELIKNKSVREFFEINVNYFLADFFEGCRQWGKVKKGLEKYTGTQESGKIFHCYCFKESIFS